MQEPQLTPAKRRRGRPSNPNFAPPSSLAGAVALHAWALVQPTVRVRFLASIERLVRSFETERDRQEREQERITRLQTDERIVALTSEVTELEQQVEDIENLRRANSDLSNRYEMSSRHAGIVEDENRRLKSRMNDLEKQVSDLKRSEAQPSVRARPPEPFDEVAYNAELERLDAESKRLGAELERRRRELRYGG